MARSVQGALQTGPSLHRVTFGQCVSLSLTASSAPGSHRVFAPLPQGSRSPAVTVGSKREPTRLWSQDAARRSRRLAQRRRRTAQGDRSRGRRGYRRVPADGRPGRPGCGAGGRPCRGSGGGFRIGVAGAGWITFHERSRARCWPGEWGFFGKRTGLRRRFHLPDLGPKAAGLISTGLGRAGRASPPTPYSHPGSGSARRTHSSGNRCSPAASTPPVIAPTVSTSSATCATVQSASS